MSKRSASHSFNAGGNCGWRVGGGNKERFASEKAARRAMKRKRKWKKADWPHPYLCEDCHGWHLGGGEGGWN